MNKKEKVGKDMNYKILFSDMDHTLLNDDLEISTENKKTIKKLVKNGIPFVFCTGRGIYGVEKYIEELDLKEGYVICQNGGTVYQLPKVELVKVKSFPVEILHPVLKAAKKRDIDIQLYYDRILMAEKMTDRIERYVKTMGTDITLIPDALKYQGNLTKCLLNAPIEKLLDLKEEIETSIVGKVNMYFSNKEFLEFTALDATKGKSMVSLAEELGIKREEVIAIGDSENDISMLQEAGLGIAVFNAVEKVKQSADIVVPYSCNEDVVAKVIKDYFKI